MKKVLVIFGTRPEAIKMCPLVLEMKKSEKLETLVCVTGQHREMLKQVLDIFNVVPDYDMAIMKKRAGSYGCDNGYSYRNEGDPEKGKTGYCAGPWRYIYCICRISGCILPADPGRTCGSGTSYL